MAGQKAMAGLAMDIPQVPTTVDIHQVSSTARTGKHLEAKVLLALDQVGLAATANSIAREVVKTAVSLALQAPTQSPAGAS